MGSLLSITADTKRQSFHFGALIIEESIDGWDWSIEGLPDTGGTCETVFEAIEAADAWLEATEQAA